MKKKLFCIFLLCLVVIMPKSSESKEKIKENSLPVRNICSHYMDLPGNFYITPYEVSLFALELVETPQYRPQVRAFLEVLFANVNSADKYGMSGTVYDFDIKDNVLKVKPVFDSIDGYSGIFLVLFQRYYELTGDRTLLDANWQKIQDIAYTIAFLQQKTGLTIALPDYPIEYLMDNCEAYGGVQAYLRLSQSLGKQIDTVYYQKIADSIKAGVYSLYSEKAGSFKWCSEKDKNSFSIWEKFYPDAYAQLFPVYYGLVTTDEQKHIWSTFIELYPAAGWKNTGLVATEQAVFCRLTQRKMEGRNNV